MTRSWKLAAQLSTAHSTRESLDPLGMLETVRRVQEAIDLDLLIVGFREAPDVFRTFCGPSSGGQHGALVRRPVRCRGHGGVGSCRELEGQAQPRLGRVGRKWRRGGGDLSLRLPEQPSCAPESRPSSSRAARRYAFDGVFLDKIRFPSPANGLDEMLSCFCDHCRAAAKSVDLDLDAVVRFSPIVRSTRPLRRLSEPASKLLD